MKINVVVVGGGYYTAPRAKESITVTDSTGKVLFEGIPSPYFTTVPANAVQPFKAVLTSSIPKPKPAAAAPAAPAAAKPAPAPAPTAPAAAPADTPAAPAPAAPIADPAAAPAAPATGG